MDTTEFANEMKDFRGEWGAYPSTYDQVESWFEPEIARLSGEKLEAFELALKRAWGNFESPEEGEDK